MGNANAPQFLRRASLWSLNDGRTTMTDGPSQHKAVLHNSVVYDTIHFTLSVFCIHYYVSNRV